MMGVWNNKTRDISSSNFQEAANLVRRLKIMLEEEQLEQRSEIFVFTDYSTFKRTYHRGSSTSKLLHEVILELCKLEMSGKLILHVIWFSGRRMIHQGSDGLSRGDFSSRVLKHWPCQYAGALGPKWGVRRRPATACGRVAGALGTHAPSIVKNNVP